MKDTSHPRLAPAAAFLAAAVGYLLIMLFAGFLKPGSTAFYRSASFQEMIPYIQSFLRVLKGEESFWYSFSVYLGSGTVAAYAAYALSPFNLLYLLGAPLPLTTCLICALKLGLCALSFYYLARKVLGSTEPVALFFSLAYALSGILLLLTTQPAWLDAAYLLPLIVLLLHRLITTGKWLLLIPVYAYLILCCYDMAAMVLIFSCFLLIAMLICRPAPAASEQPTANAPHTTASEQPSTDAPLTAASEQPATAAPRTSVWLRLRPSLAILGTYFAALLLALGLCAFLLLPLWYFLRAHQTPRSLPSFTATIPELLTMLFMGNLPASDASLPLLYCGLPLLLLLPVYLRSTHIPRREKAALGVLLALALLGMLYAPVYRLLDPLHTSDAIAYRSALCVVLLLCCGAARAASRLQTITIQQLIFSVLLSTLYYGCMLTILEFDGFGTGHSPDLLCLNLFFLLLWLSLAALCRRFPARQRLRVLLPLLLLIELCVNGGIQYSRLSLLPDSGLTPQTYEALTQNADALHAALAERNDSTLYRIHTRSAHTPNAAVLSGYPGTASSAPFDTPQLRQTLHLLGIAQADRIIDDYSAQELTDLLLGVRYHIDLTDGSLTENAYALPLGYMVSGDIYQYAPTTDPFLNQEQLLRLMTGEEYHFYEQIPADDIDYRSINLEPLPSSEETVLEINTEQLHSSILTYSVQDMPGMTPLLYLWQKETNFSATFPAHLGLGYPSLYRTPTIYDGAVIPGLPEDDSALFQTQGRWFFSIGSYVAHCSGRFAAMYMDYYDRTPLPAVYDDLAAHPIQLIQTDAGGTLRTSVTVPETRSVLFTSLPYDDAWKAYVDDIPISTLPAVGQAFLSVPLPAGVHDLILRYQPAGQSAGSLITTLTVLLCLLLVLLTYRHRRVQ